MPEIREFIKVTDFGQYESLELEKVELSLENDDVVLTMTRDPIVGYSSIDVVCGEINDLEVGNHLYIQGSGRYKVVRFTR